MTDVREATREDDVRGGDSPYVGLRNFTEKHADFFFGREEERKRVVGNLRVARLTLLYAQSGVGKSSLLRAGVMPRLRELAGRSGADRDDALDVPVIFSSWSSDPTQALIDEIANTTRAFIAEPVQLPRTSLEEAIVTATDAADATLLVILDQFEEYFSYHSRAGDDSTFPEQLARCINRAGLRANFLISIREDAYAGIGDLLKSRVANVYANYLHLEYLDEAEAREAIVEPINHWNELHDDDAPFDIEPQLVDAVVAQVRLGEVTTGDREVSIDGQGAGDSRTRIETTYLQLVMKRLWDEERQVESRVLRLATLERLGGAQTIIGTHLDVVMAQLTAEQQDAAAAVFRFLVTTTGTKIAFSAPDLAEMSGRPESELDPMLRRLTGADAQILRPVVLPDQVGGPRFEIFHDALAQPIRDWRSRYARGKEDAQRVIEQEHQREQLAAAKAQVSRERRRRVALTLVAVVLVGLLAYTYSLYQHSQDLSRREQSNSLAAQSLSEGASPELSLKLAKQAVDRKATPEALRAVRAALTKPYVSNEFAQPVSDSTTRVTVDRRPGGELIAVGGDHGAWLWDPRSGAATELSDFGPAKAIHFSADGTRVLVVGDYLAQIFDTQGQPTGEAIGPENIDDYFVDGAISPDGQRMVALTAGSHDVLVLDRDAVPIGEPLPHDSAVAVAEWSSDGRTFVTLTADKILTLWNDDGTERASLPGVNAYELSAEGTSLATGEVDHLVRLWRLPDMTQAATFATDEDVYKIEFDARRPNVLVAVGLSGTLTVLDPLDPDLPPSVIRTGQTLDRLALSAPPFLMTSGSGTVSIWDTHLGVAVEKFDVSGSVFDLRLADDGSYSFLQIDVRGRIRVWEGQTASPVGQALRANALQTSFSRDHRHLQIVYDDANGDDTPLPNGAGLLPAIGPPPSRGDGPRGGFAAEVRTYPTLTPGRLMYPSPPGAEPISSLWVGSDAQARVFVTLAQYSGNPSAIRIEVWDPTTGRKLRELASLFPHGDVNGFDVSPDGESVVVSGYDFTQTENGGYAELLATDGSSKRELDRFGGSNQAITYSNDGRILVLGDDAGRALIIEPSGGRTTVPAKGHETQGLKSVISDVSSTTLRAIAISRDSRTIATGGEDGSIVLWDLESRKPLQEFDIGKPVTALDFDDEGKFIFADGDNIPTTIFGLAGDKGRNAIMLVDPVPEPPDQSVSFELSPEKRVSVLSTDGKYLLRYPCEACINKTALLREAQRRLDASSNTQD